jgi:hypothetical protein
MTVNEIIAPITVTSQEIVAPVTLDALQVTAPVYIGQRGVPGEDGAPGVAGGVVIQCAAGEALGGHRVVVLNADAEAVYASNAVPEHLHKVLGLTTGAVLLGATATVQTGGEMTEPSWSWTLDAPIFLGTSGLLTQTPPVSGFLLVVAFPVTATKIFIKLREPLALT